MASTVAPRSCLELDLPDLSATWSLAAALARAARRGDVIGLGGELGAGKTTLARAFIHARASLLGAEADEVPSPTFTLAQIYDLPGVPVWHFDLYRLEKPGDALELGVEEAFAEAVSLIEWPERLGPLLPPDRLDVELALRPGEARHVRLTAHGGWVGRLDEVARHV